MYLHSKLEDYKGNINIAFIGCGKFISMFLSQYNQLKKIKIDTIVDLDIERAKSNCIKSGLKKETVEKINFVNSLDSILNRNIEIFIEATGNPIAGTQHAYKVIQSKKNIIMVNVEADVLCGKYLSDLAKENNITMVQLAQAFVNSRPFVTSNIIGATSMDQLKENIGSIDIKLNQDTLDKINLIHNNNPNPAP